MDTPTLIADKRTVLVGIAMTRWTSVMVAAAVIVGRSLAVLVGSADDNPAIYVARIVAVEAAQRDAYVEFLTKVKRPLWEDLRRRELVADVTVFETDKTLAQAAGMPPWNFLLLTHVAPGADARAVLRPEPQANNANAPVDSARTRRIEVLRSTPNSYYPMPAPSRAARENEAEFLIEYIAVHDTSAELNEYRETMRQTIGPSVGERVRKGEKFSFIALETITVEYAEPGMPGWNQIHINGGLPDDLPRPAALEPVYQHLTTLRTRPRIDGVRALRDIGVR
jgi:hypothetical protein